MIYTSDAGGGGAAVGDELPHAGADNYNATGAITFQTL